MNVSRILIVAAAAVMAGLFAATPARADDESALQQLQDIQHSSQDAVNAPSDEQARDLASQGFDTTNNDPAPDGTPLPDVPDASASSSDDGN